MSDILVRLYDLPQFKECDAKLNEYDAKLLQKGVDIRRAIAPDKSRVVSFVKENFGERWASECDISFSNKPVSCFIAVKDNKQIVGFACYEATCKNFFGPIGTMKEYRKDGIGRSLLLHSLYGLKEMGYAYCIIGGGSHIYDSFYNKVVSCEIIPGSSPGIYKDLLG